MIQTHTKCIFFIIIIIINEDVIKKFLLNKPLLKIDSIDLQRGLFKTERIPFSKPAINFISVTMRWSWVQANFS